MSKPKQPKQFVLFKICTCCQKEMAYDSFRIQMSSPDGMACHCITCTKTKQQIKYKTRDLETKLKKTKYLSERYLKNKEKIKPYLLAYIKIYNKQPWTKIPHNLRKRLADKTKFKSKIGLKTKELKVYLESLFLPEMTWENYGKVWEIRLIRPINDFDLNNLGEVSQINHYRNLKPSFSPQFLKSREALGVLRNQETKIPG